ncbi:FAD-dependent monooxygenase [Streptomyces sp. NPDC091412]|uniref:FAD-dependent monooxygenase n=1 Tax=Streptomyces sp. NPDC091412 TaxID=3366002 RepID=UPI00380A8D72
MERDGRRSVLVVGGGIGGLTAATALRRLGHRVELVELRGDWTVSGWGLSLTGPALRALDALDLAEPCLALGYGITKIAHCDGAGHVRTVIDLPGLLGEGRPSQSGIARPDLARVLREAAEKHGATLRTSLTVTRLGDESDGVRAELSDGTTRDVDLVVVADGVGSRTRALLGFTEKPEYNGQMVWRAVVPRPAWADRLFTFAGTTHNAGLIPVSSESAYCFLTENTPVQEPLPDGELATRMRELLAPFGGRVAEVRESIVDAGAVVRRPVRTVLVEAPWHRGRTVLLGDAAHTPSPQLVSGAALAIEDAVVLAQELERHAETAGALEAFSSRRIERARLVVEASREIARLEQADRHGEVYELQGRCHGALAAPT